MNREDIICMAREAGASDAYDAEFCFNEYELMKFVSLIAEDCAKRCDEVFASAVTLSKRFGAEDCADSIREAYKP